MPEKDLTALFPNLTFSQVEGFSPASFDYKCPRTEMPCPEKMSLISNYVGDVEGVSTEAVLMREKLIIKLGEYRAWATVVDCEPEDKCTIRTRMNESLPRRNTVSLIRRTRAFFSKHISR